MLVCSSMEFFFFFFFFSVGLWKLFMLILYKPASVVFFFLIFLSGLQINWQHLKD